jgi:hypothetical protein
MSRGKKELAEQIIPKLREIVVSLKQPGGKRDHGSQADEA